MLRTWMTILGDDVAARVMADLGQVVGGGAFRGGQFIARFEERLGEDFAASAVGVGSGMDGIELAFEALNVSGRRVLLPGNCFQSLPAVVARLGGVPVPVPVDPVFMSPVLDGMDLADRPAVLWVHHLGMVAPDAPGRIAALHAAGCVVVEDCAYVSFGSGGGVGGWGAAAVLTFGPTKPNSGSGGGAVVTRDSGLAAEVAARRNHGGQEALWRAGGSVVRWRSMAEMDAVVAYHQWCARGGRGRVLEQLSAAYASGLDTRCLPAGRSPRPSWGRFLVEVGDRDGGQVRRALAGAGIATTCMYERPWFDFPALRAVTDIPRDEDWDDLRGLLGRSFCVPFHPAMTEGDVAAVCAALGSFSEGVAG